MRLPTLNKHPNHRLYRHTLLVKVVDINNGLVKNFTIANDFVCHSDSSLVHVKYWLSNFCMTIFSLDKWALKNGDVERCGTYSLTKW